MPNQCTGSTIIQSYQRHNAKCHTITWLSGHTGRSNTNIQCKQYDLSCAQQCKLPQQTQGTQQSRWPLLLIKQHTASGKKWCNPQHCTHHQKRHVIGNRSRTSSSLYYGMRSRVYIRIILKDMGHKQPPTPMQTDNAMADGVINGKVQPIRTNAMDMRFHWLWDRECQQQFRIYWQPGKLNYTDYWTKHHPTAHHRNIRKEFLTAHTALAMLRIEQGVAAKAA
jgi:hypothetical protein